MRYLTAGESHGPQLTTIIEGVPAGLYITKKTSITSFKDVKRPRPRTPDANRKDQARITSGVRHGRSLGSPIALVVETMTGNTGRNHGFRADHG
ncbi:chorismate synthase [Bacillus licheniformis]|nr:chorismate synthase [Bacillus licheniformis]